MTGAPAKAERLTDWEMDGLRELGWDFLPYAPNEWQWMKFENKIGMRIANQCDEVWERDLADIKARHELADA